MAISNLILIYGTEPYLIDKEIERVRAELSREGGAEAELVYIDADELTAQQLLEQLDFSPLFALERVVVIRRPSWLGKTRRKASKVEQLVEGLAAFLSEPIPGQVVIFTAEEDVSSHPLMKKLGKAVHKVACVRPNPQGLETWVKQLAAALNQPLAPPVAKMLASSGQDMYYLQRLLEKLSLQKSPEMITEQDVAEELDQQIETSVFKLTDALLNRRSREALKAYYQLLRQGGQPTFFLYMIIRQFMLLGKVKHFSQEGMPQAAIAKATGARDFAVKRLLSAASQYSWDELKRCFELFLQADINLKSSGRDGKIVLEALIIEVCGQGRRR